MKSFSPAQANSKINDEKFERNSEEKLQNISKEIVKHSEKFMNPKRAHMSQFHSRIVGISSCVTSAFGLVRKCASIYGNRGRERMSYGRREIKDAIKQSECFMSLLPAAVAYNQPPETAARQSK
jgi:hypothetical protein